jgi:hypothetical protein
MADENQGQGLSGEVTVVSNVEWLSQDGKLSVAFKRFVFKNGVLVGVNPGGMNKLPPDGKFQSVRGTEST